MNTLHQAVSAEPTAARSEPERQLLRKQRPSFRWSDLWKAPLHDFPIRDEILYQYLPLSSVMDVLEIGPGSGFTAFRLARQVRHLAAVDVAANNVRLLRKKLKGLPNLTLICADVCALKFAECVGRAFDAAYALEVFELLPDPGACLRNLAEVLHPGGRLLLQFPNYPPPKNPGVTYFRTREELDLLLRAAGFAHWDVHALRLRPLAGFIHQEFHERPLRVYRRLRTSNGSGKPLVYDESWAFQQGRQLERYRYILHGAWAALFAALRLAGDCFENRPLGNEILGHNLLLLAQR